MIYLQANPLLKEPLKPDHIKDRLLGHWGSSPGLAGVYCECSPEALRISTKSFPP
jgi:xylulose-5-phosphate/fructose-6-phosphate phosphoketolase